MYRVRYAFCCEKHIIDLITKNVSAIEILDVIVGVNFPLMMPSLVVVASIERDESDANDVEFEISISQGERTLSRESLPTTFRQKLRTRTLINYEGFLIPTTGVLNLRLSVGETALSEWSVNVRDTQPKPQQQIFDDE